MVSHASFVYRLEFQRARCIAILSFSPPLRTRIKMVRKRTGQQPSRERTTGEGLGIEHIENKQATRRCTYRNSHRCIAWVSPPQDTQLANSKQGVRNLGKQRGEGENSKSTGPHWTKLFTLTQRRVDASRIAFRTAAPRTASPQLPQLGGRWGEGQTFF